MKSITCLIITNLVVAIITGYAAYKYNYNVNEAIYLRTQCNYLGGLYIDKQCVPMRLIELEPYSGIK